MSSPAPKANEETQAEVLIWQARYRVLFVPLIGFSTVTLKWFGVISSESLFIAKYSLREILLAVVALMVAYLLGHWVLVVYLRKTKRASTGLVVSTIATDVILLFAVVALISPPEYFHRALIVSIFTVQFTQIFFGWMATLTNLVLIAVGYTTLIALAADAGRLRFPMEELWTLALLGIGALLYVVLQGHVTAQMNRLVEMLSKAREGDFSDRFEEGDEPLPNPVSVIGRAYNQMREHLQTIVLTDPLSGCFNRRGLNQLAEREVSRAVRQKKELAVLTIDLDHFKRVNDEYGHLTGDEVIREVGELLRRTAREADIVARFGGEEFTILAPETNEEGALILADRVMYAFRSHTFCTLPPDSRLTASIGIAAEFARDDEVAKVLLARADEALYVAKRNGRDRSAMWHPGMRAFDGSASQPRATFSGMLRVSE